MTVNVEETYWLFGKEKNSGVLSVKKAMFIVFWDIKLPIKIYFLEKYTTGNNVSYRELHLAFVLKQFKTVMNKRVQSQIESYQRLKKCY